jgi:muramoyltetrapeptide carboxypeptidase LdcA involved in peptidoglycan recycling
LRRHKVIKKIRGLVIGSLSGDAGSPRGGRFQRKALLFMKAYLGEIMKRRQRQGYPLPILVSRNFGHNVARNLPIIPIGGRVSIDRSKRMIFRLAKKETPPPGFHEGQ